MINQKITFAERLQIENLTRLRWRPIDIALELGRSEVTIRVEIRKYKNPETGVYEAIYAQENRKGAGTYKKRFNNARRMYRIDDLQSFGTFIAEYAESPLEALKQAYNKKKKFNLTDDHLARFAVWPLFTRQEDNQKEEELEPVFFS